MDILALFERAAAYAARGEYRGSAQAYETVLEQSQRPGSSIPLPQRPQVVRSAAFNLAQVLNKLKEYAKAIDCIELGMSLDPTDTGRAIALAAKGEALCGLNREKEGNAAFAEAARAHPIIGRLNSADSMTRMNSAVFDKMAEDLVATVVGSHGHQLNTSLREEANTILSTISARRGHKR
jgi:tetratricopeptide (TPR) repeat protein